MLFEFGHHDLIRPKKQASLHYPTSAYVLVQPIGRLRAFHTEVTCAQGKSTQRMSAVYLPQGA